MDGIIVTLAIVVFYLTYWMDAPGDASRDNGGRWR